MIARKSNGAASSFIRNQNTPNTRKAYGIGLEKFLRWVEDPDAPIIKGVGTTDSAQRMFEMDQIAAAYLGALRSGRRPGRDLVDFLAAMTREEFSGSSRRVARNAVVGFLEDNEIELSHIEAKNVRKRLGNTSPVAQEDNISIKILRQFLPHMRTPYRTMALVLLATGARVGEVLQLRTSDIDLDATPAKVTFRRGTTKTRTGRFSFLTPEAVDAVRAWLAVRDDYIKSARARAANLSNGEGENRDGFLFPFSDTVFFFAWKSALKKAGLFSQCEETGRATIHPHGLRKYFRTYFGAAAGVDVAETLMGHQGYLAGAYVRLTEQDLATAYAANAYVLTVSQGGSGDLVRKMADLQARNDALEQQLRDVRQVVDERNSANEQIWSDPRFQAKLDEAVRRMHSEAS